MKRRHLLCLSFALPLITTAAFGQKAVGQGGSTFGFSPIPTLTNPTIQALHASEIGGLVNMDINFEGRTYQVDLEPYSVRAGDFVVYVSDNGGPTREVASPSFTTFRGTIKDDQGSLIESSGAVANRTAEGWEMMLDLPQAGEMIFVQPVDSLGSGLAASGMHAIYRASETTGNEDYICGTDTSGLEPFNPDDHGPDAERAANGNTNIRIAIDTDVEYWEANGSDVDATVADIEGVMNTTDFIFERDTQVSYEITAIVVRTGARNTDPYFRTDPGDRLTQMRQYWNANLTAVKRDVAHLFTGIDLDGNVIGVAFLRVVCFPANAYALSQSLFTGNFGFRVTLTTHELGHNFNSRHCDELLTVECCTDCHIMCSGLSGCNGIGTPNFGQLSIGQIRGYVDDLTCASIQTVLGIPFSDTVPTGTIDASLWVYNDTVVPKMGSKNKPSEPFTMRFNVQGTGTEPGVADEIRSHPIDLSGETDVTLTYFTEYRRCEGGEALICEYIPSGSISWSTLNTTVATAMNQKFYDMHSIVLPGDALHDEFQVRFRMTGDQSNDQMYIDDISINVTGALTQGRRGLDLGQVNTIETFGARAGERVVFLTSLVGKGEGPTVFGSLELELLPPFSVLGSAIADENGQAVLEFVLPEDFGSSEVHTQAVVFKGEDSVKSNVVTHPVNRQ